MNALDYVRLLRRGWWITCACVVAFMLLGWLVTVATPRRYRAESQVFVTTAAPSASANELALADTYVQARVQSYPTIATSPLVTERVIAELGLHETPSELASRITATARVGTVLINVSVLDPEPAEAARVADAVANQFGAAIEQVESTPASLSSRVKVSVVRKAQVPTQPASPRPAVNLALALVLGLVVGIPAAILRGVLDTRVRSADGLGTIGGAPLLGAIPRDRSAPDHPLVIWSGSQGARAEAFRTLRTNLQFVSVDDPPRIIAVTSAVTGEGKTTTALNLAAALAEAGHRVRLVEADLRRPTLADSLGLVGELGVTSVLLGTNSYGEAMQFLEIGLGVLTSGALPPNPSEVLASAQMRTLVGDLAADVDYTIIDTSPLLPVTDGAEVARLADATLLVVRAGKSTYLEVKAAVAGLAKVGVCPVGTVLNGARIG